MKYVYSDLVEALPTLTEHQLKDLKVRIDLLLPSVSKGDAAGEGAFYTAFMDIMRQETVVDIPPLSAVKRTTYYKQYHESYLYVEQFIDQYAPSVTKVGRIKAWHVIMKATVRYLRGLSIPVSPKPFWQHLKKIREILSIQFPGYLENNMFSIILDSDRRNS